MKLIGESSLDKLLALFPTRLSFTDDSLRKSQVSCTHALLVSVSCIFIEIFSNVWRELFKRIICRFERDQLGKDELVDGLEEKFYSGIDYGKD